MIMQRYTPTDYLKPFIKAFLIIESDTELRNRVVPDTSIVMAFRYKGTVTSVSENQFQSMPSSAVSGLRKSGRILVYAPNTATLLILFQEGGAAAFFSEPLHELFGQSMALDDLIPHRIALTIEEQLAESQTNYQRVNLVEQFLLSRLIKPTTEPLITQAIRQIKTAHGHTGMKSLADSLHISQDAFEKRFRRIIGTTPKQFAALVRFRHLLSTQTSEQRLTELAYESGYFDQAHFIKDFRSFTGQAPHDFFKSSLYW
ncbi:helix-turn-helix domain-containing protein [Spirosoma harenae]